VFDFAKHFALIDQTLKPPTNLLLKILDYDNILVLIIFLKTLSCSPLNIIIYYWLPIGT
jgi:hypothetical protein